MLRAGRSGVRILAGTTDLSLLQNAQTGPGPHPASYPVCTGVCFFGVEQAVFQVDHLPLSFADVKNEWRYTSTGPICLHDEHKGFSYFIIIILSSLS